MASADPGVLDRLIAVLREGSSLRLALLFGSAARDGLRPDSDLDIGILPSDPQMSLHTELDLQSRLERVAGRPVDLVRLDRASTVLSGRPRATASRSSWVRVLTWSGSSPRPPSSTATSPPPGCRPSASSASG